MHSLHKGFRSSGDAAAGVHLAEDVLLLEELVRERRAVLVRRVGVRGRGVRGWLETGPS